VDDENLTGEQNSERVNKSDDTFNYEISKRMRATQKPMAVMTRLSVAAVVDGLYEYKTDENGNKTRVYVPRSAEEMKQFEDIVVKAMGYNEERSDQVSMECFPFASIADIETAPQVSGIKKVQEQYGRLIANLLLVLLLFLFVIRPIIKTVRDIKTTVEHEALPGPEELALIEEEEKEPSFIEMDGRQQREYLEMMTDEEKNSFMQNMSATERAVYLEKMSVNEKARYYADKDFGKTINILKGWISETTED
jgi:flagellar M-ring protein FliF